MSAIASEHVGLRLWRQARRYGTLVSFVLLVGTLLAISPSFRTPVNLLSLLQQNAILGIVSCGMLMMIIVGGFDLSVGSVGALASVVAAFAFVHLSIPVGVLLALVSGLLVGLVNGLLIAKVGINPFVATLGMQIVVSGLLFVATNAEPVYGLPPAWTVVGLGFVGPFPVATSLFFVSAVVTWAILRLTRFGHYVYAVGGNEEASRLAGVDVDRVKVLTYMLGGLFASVGGLILLGETNTGQPAAATSWPLTAIAIVVVGGTPLTGGVGTVYGVILGTLLLGTVANALNLLNVSPYWQPAVTGLIILAAVGADRMGKRRGRQGSV